MAIAARAPPIAIAPVSPMITSAGNALYQRKPMVAPISAAPTIARSSLLSKRPPGLPERMYVTTEIAVSVSIAMIPVPAASPSRPSVRLTPFVVPAITRNNRTYQPQDSSTFQCAMGMNTLVGSCWCSAAKPTPTVINARPSIFQRPRKPSERRCVSLMKSSRNPIAPQPSVTKRTVSAGTLYFDTARNAPVATTRISRPPIVGVPCLTRCASGSSSRMCWPNSFFRRNAMNLGPTTIDTTIATTPAARTRITGASRGWDLCECFCHSFETDGPGCFHEDGVAGTYELVHLPQCIVDVRDPASGNAAFKVPTRELADCQELVHAQLGGGLADFPVVLRACSSELGHVAQDRDPPPGPGSFHEIREGCAHRDGVRVVRVVDQQPAARELVLFPTPPCEVDLDAFRARQAERLESGKRCRCVLHLVPSREVETDTADDRAAVDALRGRLPDSHDLDVVSRDREIARNDRRPTRRQRCDQLPFHPGNALERIDELEMHRPHVRHHPDLRARDRGQLGDLAEAPHGELENADLGVFLQPAERQWHADLVVVAGLRSDRPRYRRAKSGQDVLRRGLPHRPCDRDDACRAPGANRGTQACQRSERVVGDERRRRAVGDGVVEKVRPLADGDEEVAWNDAPRIDLHTGEAVRADIVMTQALEQRSLERDHAGALSARSASRATSRSSKGSLRPAISCPCS